MIEILITSVLVVLGSALSIALLKHVEEPFNIDENSDLDDEEQ